MKEINEPVIYVVRGPKGFPIDVAYGERLDDRRFALRRVEVTGRWQIEHIVTGARAFSAETPEAALQGFEKLLKEKGEDKLTEAFEKAALVIREYEESLL